MDLQPDSKPILGDMGAFGSLLSSIRPTIFSSMTNYYAVAMTIVDPSDTPPEDAANRIWGSLTALIVFPSVFFVAAYVKFMRMDIR